MSIKELYEEKRKKVVALSLATAILVTLTSCSAIQTSTEEANLDINKEKNADLPKEESYIPITSEDIFQMNSWYPITEQSYREDKYEEKIYPAGTKQMIAISDNVVATNIVGLDPPEWFDVVSTNGMAGGNSSNSSIYMYAHLINNKDILIKEYTTRAGKKYYRDYGTPIRKEKTLSKTPNE